MLEEISREKYMTEYISHIQQFEKDLMSKNTNGKLNFQVIFPSLQMHM